MKNWMKWMIPAAGLLIAGCGTEPTDEGETRSSELDGTLVDGNPSCADLGYDHEFKIDDTDGRFLFDGYNTVDVTYDGTLVDWTSTLAMDAVIVKGGPAAMVYEYDPEAYSDTGLATPDNPNNDGRYGISHVSFCYDYELTVNKTAETSYTRTWDWDITKSVDPAEHQLDHGETGTSGYTVTVTNLGYVDSDFAVEGTVTVSNETPFEAELTAITDSLSNGTDVTLDCDTAVPTTMAPGDTITCTYDEALADSTDLVNTATAEVSDASAVDGDSATADASFGSATVTAINETVNIEDDYEGDVSSLGTISASTVYSYDREFTCGDEGLNNNTASIVETGHNDSAAVRVVCAHDGAQGCTPGYWKNPRHDWEGYDRGDRVVDVFVEAAPYVGPRDSLQKALKYRGGPSIADAAQTLLRAAVAGLLDTAHSGVDYPLTTAELIDKVNTALASGDRGEILYVKDVIDQYNNLGCPL